MKIVVLDGYTLNPGDNPWIGLETLGSVTVHDHSLPTEVVSRAEGAEILIVNKVRLSREIMEQLPKLRLIAVTATGFDCVDIGAAASRGIPVVNVPEYGTYSVAQYVFALLLHLCHRVDLHSDLVRCGAWGRRPDFSFWETPLVELQGLTMGIVGFGRIGRQVGVLANAFGMRVLANDVAQNNPPAYQPFDWAEQERVFASADVVTLHCNLTAENQQFVNKSLLQRMKTSAFLINTSRGGLIQEADLADALKSGTIAGAAIDVVSREPIQQDNPLFGAPNCVITPHIAWATLAARRRLMQTTVDNVASFLSGSPTNVVNRR